MRDVSFCLICELISKPSGIALGITAEETVTIYIDHSLENIFNKCYTMFPYSGMK